MQTLTIDIKDDFMTEFMKIIDTVKDNVVVRKDGVPLECENLEYDPYFYERQKQLQQDIEDIDSGKIEMLSQEQYDIEMHDFITELKSKYAN